MRKTIGILAHVDAGKTTFSEQILLAAGALRTAGRVDRGDTLLDSHPLERARGITIFSGQAVLQTGGDTVFWLDTPGHPDFAAEAERALPVLDYAVLLISSAAGIQSHTRTLWRLLARYEVPVFVFLSKTDLPSADPDAVLAALREQFSGGVVDLRGFQRSGALSEAEREEIALRCDGLTERYLEDAVREEEWLPALRQAVRRRRIFPVMAGAALRGEGVPEFLSALCALTETDYEAKEALPLRLRCWRIAHEDGRRVAFLKVESGCLLPKEPLPGGQKATELWRVHGETRTPLRRAAAGELVAVPGLAGVLPGGVPGEDPAAPPVLLPMTERDVFWDDRLPAFRMLERLRELEEEDPTLRIAAEDGRLSVRTGGRLQAEVLSSLVQARWGQAVSFGPPRILYRETVAAPAVGIGHYEPLRHYAEAWLRLVPAPPGSGVRFESLCSVNDLALNWQRLIETHVFEREHKGVLVGAPLTDVTVQLLCGRAHLKHTEGGDFRQAVGRAVRCALMRAESVLLEPVCRYEIRVPREQAGRVSAALSQLRAAQDPPAAEGEDALLCGEARLARLIPFQEDFPALTKGLGSLSLSLSRYAPCEPAEQAAIVGARGYNPLADDTPDSVFCAHGAGYTVSWDRVRDFAHCEYEEPAKR